MRIVLVSKGGGKEDMTFPRFAVAYSMGYWWGNGILKLFLLLLVSIPMHSNTVLKRYSITPITGN